MFKRQNRNIIILILLTCISQIIYLCFEYYFANGNIAFPLDDSWIYLRFADNFSKGHFFEYNIGEPTTGATSPLWVVILGILHILIPDLIVLNLVLPSLFFILLVILTYKISTVIYQKLNFENYEFLSFITSILVIINGRLNWSALSGMETICFMFFSLLTFYFIFTKQNSLVLIFASAGLAAVSRPEGFLLVLIVIIYCLTKGIYKKLLLGLFVLLLITSPYIIFSYITNGTLFPNTFAGKGAKFHPVPDFHFLRIATIYFLRDNFITGLFFLVGIVMYIINFRKFRNFLKETNLIYIWIYLYFIALSITLPIYVQHARYAMPLIPVITITSIINIAFIVKIVTFKKLKSIVYNKYIYYAIIFLSFPYYYVYGTYIGKNTANINDQQVKIAYWVRDNIPRENVMAINDIGIITYLNGNKIVDMIGLIDHKMANYRNYQTDVYLDSMYNALKASHVSYVIIYDSWFPEFVGKYKNKLEFITSAKLEKNTICGDDEMKIYKIHFDD